MIGCAYSIRPTGAEGISFGRFPRIAFAAANSIRGYYRSVPPGRIAKMVQGGQEPIYDNNETGCPGLALETCDYTNLNPPRAPLAEGAIENSPG